MRACRFSSATSCLGPGEQAGERPAIRLEHVRDRHRVDPHAQATGALDRVLRALGRGVLGRHREQANGFGTQGVGGERGDQRRVDPAGHPDHDLAEPVLAHVVAEAQHQRSVDLLRPGRPGGLLRPGDERRTRRHRASGTSTNTRSSSNIAPRATTVAVGRDDHRAAVEHELVLAADGVHVDEPRAGLTRAIAADLQPFLALAVVIRRAVDVQDDAGACGRTRRTARRRATRPRRPTGPAPTMPGGSSRRRFPVRSSASRRTRRSSGAGSCDSAPAPGRLGSTRRRCGDPRSDRSTNPTITAHDEPAVEAASASSAARLSWTNVGRRTRSSGG